MDVSTFIVGTGRCGSTMLSSMLREHPRVLSLSDFFSYVTDTWACMCDAFGSDPMDGRRFWAVITEVPPHATFALRHGVEPETFYPYRDPQARFSAITGIPAILQTTLPHLTNAPDALFSVLEDEVRNWPPRPIGEHYQHLFGWLTKRFDKALWVERSSSALPMTEHILSAFPGARMIHVVRDGRDTAISMYEHMGHRFALAMILLQQFLGVDPIQSADRTHIDRVPAALRALLPENFDAAALRNLALPPTLGAEFWSQQIEAGLKALSTLPKERLLTLRYEDLLSEPKAQLDTLAAFLGQGLVDDAWSTRCAAAVGKPQSSWRDLPEQIARALTDACRPAFAQLRATGVNYDV